MRVAPRVPARPPPGRRRCELPAARWRGGRLCVAELSSTSGGAALAEPGAAPGGAGPGRAERDRTEPNGAERGRVQRDGAGSARWRRLRAGSGPAGRRGEVRRGAAGPGPGWREGGRGRPERGGRGCGGELGGQWDPTGLGVGGGG